VWYTLCWFAAIFIFFSSAHGKCLIYILPAFPPLAILAGWTIGQVQAGARRSAVRRLFKAGSAIIGIASLGMIAAAVIAIEYGVAARFASRLHPTDRRFLELLLHQAFEPRLVFWAAVSLVGAGLIMGGLLRGAPTWETYGTLLIAAAGGWFWFGVMNPALAQGESLKNFARQAAALVPPGLNIGHFGLGDCELNFYSPRPLEPIAQVSCTGHAPVQYIIIREQDFNGLPTARRECFAVELAATPNDSIGPRLLLKRTGP
jgi:hypothetical protein